MGLCLYQKLDLKTIQPRVHIEYQTFKNIIAALVDKQIFFRAGRGELEANPFFLHGETGHQFTKEERKLS